MTDEQREPDEAARPEDTGRGPTRPIEVPTPDTGMSDTGTPEAGATAADTASAPRRGRVRLQDETTTPREPTVAERRARERARRRREQEEQLRLEEEAAGKRKRKRILVGAGATVGIVALIAVGYSAAQPDDETNAQCVDEQSGVTWKLL